jgi:ribosomal protein S27E
MQEEKSSNKRLQNCDVKLRTEEPAFRTVKSCPNCHSIVVMYQKWKGAYRCNNCGQYFKDPVFKQIKDRRNELPVPPTLKKRAYDRASR